MLRGIDTEEPQDATDKEDCNSGGPDVEHRKEARHLKEPAGAPIMAEKIVYLLSPSAEMVLC